MSATGAASRLEALQATLAAEHAAVHVLGALGGQTSQSARPGLFDALRSAYEAHRSRRDHLVAVVAEAGGTPVAAEPAYRLPERLGSPALVARRARELEEACAATYAYLVASSTDETREWAVRALTDAALRVLELGGAPSTLPGLR